MVHGPRTTAGTAHALVFAPVTPSWDEGAFFAPVIRTLTGAGLWVTVVDTLALLDEDVRTLAGLVARWRTLLPAFGRVDLLCGNALGGAVAQELLPHLAPETATLLVSGPARTDPLLNHRLTEIADLAATGHTDAALALLHHRVLPDEPSAPDPAPATGPAAGHAGAADAPAASRQTAARRLDGGLRLLCGIDVGPAVEAHPGPLLHIVGGRSQLVTRRHTAAGPRHRVHVVPEAGMRPHTEQPAEVSALIETFLREKGLT
ncbi:alpha/beta fold hydrolase [Streptomyces koelreuteriae]|uniref:alpha/beta fold hydrolase n=1 Tax=Streptomyces koelreuteriae TaxID=2838015 RepID=UPI003EBE686B